MEGVDFDFCSRQYGFSRAEAITWFGSQQLRDYRTPNRRFSPIDYLLANADVSSALEHPVRHYLSFGVKEARPSIPAPIDYRPFRGNLRADTQPAPKIAIVLHVYYRRYLAGFIERLSHLNDTVDFKIFISTTSELHEECSAAFLAQFPEHRIDCRQVLNRGRNIAPMLTIFRDEISDYDVVVHCHSKLSEYSGREQIEWASYLISAMIGCEQTITSHARAIASNGCDLIAPVPFKGISPWASHSLSNDRLLRMLQSKVGLPPETGFITYPVGGMFVASKSLFRRLVDLDLKIEDFPTEPSAPDGEIHHAIERLLGSLAGDRLAFFDQVMQIYCDRTSVLQEELDRFAPIKDLDETISQYGVISFDFFDTLILRCSGDEEWAKKRVGRIFNCDYQQLRNDAETVARERLAPSEDVGFPQVVRDISNAIGGSASELLAAERSIDLGDLRPNPIVAKSYEKAIASGKTVLIVSDTYYGSDLIKTFIHDHALPSPSQVIVSSEIGLRKDRGDLWDHLRSRFGKSLLHVGDNVQSDIQTACDRGIATFYVPHWRNALLRSNGLSRKIGERNRFNSNFNCFAEDIRRENEAFT